MVLSANESRNMNLYVDGTFKRQCDYCRSECEETNYIFPRETYSDDLYGLRIRPKVVDICPKCQKRIVEALRKEFNRE